MNDSEENKEGRMNCNGNMVIRNVFHYIVFAFFVIPYHISVLNSILIG